MQVYNRSAAVLYAHLWAMGRNPAYYDFENIGGDCTNYASQVLYAGAGVMDFRPVYGWFYCSLQDRAPAWTGVEFLYNYLTRASHTPGPVAVEVTAQEVEPGDIIQLSFQGERYQHSPVVVAVGSEILVAAHSIDCDYRPLSTYTYTKARFLHILGVYPSS